MHALSEQPSPGSNLCSYCTCKIPRLSCPLHVFPVPPSQEERTPETAAFIATMQQQKDEIVRTVLEARGEVLGRDTIAEDFRNYILAVRVLMDCPSPLEYIEEGMGGSMDDAALMHLRTLALPADVHDMRQLPRGVEQLLESTGFEAAVLLILMRALSKALPQPGMLQAVNDIITRMQQPNVRRRPEQRLAELQARMPGRPLTYDLLLALFVEAAGVQAWHQAEAAPGQQLAPAVRQALRCGVSGGMARLHVMQPVAVAG